MIRPVILATAALALGAGAARADDCEPEGWAGDARTPVTVAGGHAFVLVFGWNDETFGQLGPGDDVTAWTLSPSGSARAADLTGKGFQTTAPSLAGGGDVVQWRQGPAGSDLVATPVAGGADRVLVPGLPFPGYRAVGAATAPDGTTTVVFGIPGPGDAAPGSIGVRRVAPDGTAGPVTTLPGVGANVSARVAVDAQGNAFAAVSGDSGGQAIRWPAGGAPVAAGALALRDGTTSVVPDGTGGAWIVVRGGRVARLTPAGLSAARRRGAHVQAVAVGASGQTTALVLRRGRALLLRRGRRTVVLRSRRGYQQGDASVAVGADGRAWVVWEETSDGVDECEFPLHAAVRWASVARDARRATSRVLRGAPVEQTFSP